MTDKSIVSVGVVGGEYFRLWSSNKGLGKDLNYYLNLFDPNDYIIYKATNNFRPISYDDFLKFKYAQYFFFKKDLYDNESIETWVEFCNKLGVQYLIKPFPKFNPKRIIIK
jgi:hypothetical protein